jgi:hypothetical protein
VTTRRRPRTRDPVHLDGERWLILAEAVAPEPGFWLGRPDAEPLLQRFLPRDAWRLRWNRVAERWEGSA